MYLAINDEVIATKQKEIKELNDRIIDEHYALPFWIRWFKYDNICNQVMTNWANYKKWMNRRIKEQSRIHNEK